MATVNTTPPKSTACSNRSSTAPLTWCSVRGSWARPFGCRSPRRLLLKTAVLYTRLTTRLAVTDTHNGFRALSRTAATQIRIRQPRMAHASEILEEIARHRLRWTEAAVTIRYTEETLAKGQSSWDAFRISGQLMLGRLVR